MIPHATRLDTFRITEGGLEAAIDEMAGRDFNPAAITPTREGGQMIYDVTFLFREDIPSWPSLARNERTLRIPLGQLEAAIFEIYDAGDVITHFSRGFDPGAEELTYLVVYRPRQSDEEVLADFVRRIQRIVLVGGNAQLGLISPEHVELLEKLLVKAHSDVQAQAELDAAHAAGVPIARAINDARSATVAV